MSELNSNTCETNPSYIPQIPYGKTGVPHHEAEDTQDITKNKSYQSQYQLRRLISDEHNPNIFMLYETIFQCQVISSIGTEADYLVISDNLIANLLFDIDLEYLPSSERLSSMIKIFIEEDSSECRDAYQSSSAIIPQRPNSSSDLCAIISTLNSVHSMRRLKDVQSIELELMGTHKISEGKTVQIFNIKGQDIHRSKLKRFSVFVAQFRA